MFLEVPFQFALVNSFTPSVPRYTLRILSKVETFNDQQRMNRQVLSLEPVDYNNGAAERVDFVNKQLQLGANVGQVGASYGG